jgi:formate dehydrogenase maturation protein FdhE
MSLKCEVCGTLQKGNAIPRKCQGCGQTDRTKYTRVEAEVDQVKHDRDRAYLESRRV